MGGLRQLIERDLAVTIEGDFGLPITFVAPDGSSFTVQGQVLYEHDVFDAQTGVNIVVRKPIITVRRSSLTRVPLDDERWAVMIPSIPSEDAALVTLMIEQPVYGGGSIGTMSFALTAVEQIEEPTP